MKIKYRLSLIVIALMVAAIGIVSSIILTRSYSLQLKAVDDNIALTAEETAKDIALIFQEPLMSLRAVATMMEGFDSINPEDRRTYFTKALEQLLFADSNYLGAWTCWEPNALDGLDDQYRNTPASDRTGRFIPNIVKKGGSSVISALTDYETPGLSDYYLYSRNSGKAAILDPYPHMMGDQITSVISITMPIKSNGRVVGVVGFDVGIDVIQDLVDKTVPYGSGGVSVVSGTGIMVADYDHAKSGQNVRTHGHESIGITLGQIADSISSGLKFTTDYYSGTRDTEMTAVFVPIRFEGVDRPWSVMAAVPLTVVMKPVNDMLLFVSLLVTGIIVVVSVVIFFIASGIMKPVSNVADLLKNISEGEGDLTQRLNITSKDEIGEMAKYFDLTMEKIRQLVVSIKEKSSSLTSIGTELSSNMTETAAAINQITSNIEAIKQQTTNQSASVTETNAVMEEITRRIQDLNGHIETQSVSISESSSSIEEMIANIASVTKTLVENTGNISSLVKASDLGRGGLQDVSQEISSVAKDSEGLLEITAVMENIASQTNLLSMNAAIEAAHAGEAGRGFSVVAEEIRKLAESSGEQSKTIATVLKKIKDSIDAITNSTEEVLKRFEVIDEGIKTVDTQEEHIRNAMEEQETGSKQILQAVGTLNDLTQKVKDSAVEMLEGSNQVIQESRNLEILTQEINGGMNEMATGANEMNTAVHRVNEISGENKDHIGSLEAELSRFKVD